MKRLLVILFAFAATMYGLSAQDFSPSQQAQGYLDAQNTTVDHATGLFHYRVPIYTLRSGDFELPISLNYVGKSLKIDDQAGLVGYNWNLSVGGIVTRTLRGGFADEVGYTYGYFGNQAPQNNLEDSVRFVNMRKLDGENDIFTAVFNGRSVNFIIKKNVNNSLFAEPLERTNVKIDIINANWKITDEDGNIFYFEKPEVSRNPRKQDAMSFGGDDYTASWHLTRIEPRNSPPVIYNYREENHTVQYTSGSTSEYFYGKPMIEMPLDLKESEYEGYLDVAQSFLTTSLHQLLANSEYLTYVWNEFTESMESYWATNWNAINNYQTNRMIMGQLAEFPDVQNAEALIAYLQVYYGILIDQQGSTEAYSAAMVIQDAVNAVRNSVKRQEYTRHRRTPVGIATRIEVPVLYEIVCDDVVVRFDYGEPSEGGYPKPIYAYHMDWFVEQYGYFQARAEYDASIAAGWNYIVGYDYKDISRLYSIHVECTRSKEKIVHVAFGISGFNRYLNQLSFIGKDGVTFGRMKFGYHSGSYPSGPSVGYGWMFGVEDYTEENGNPMSFNFNDENSRRGLLSTITTPDGGIIRIDYEANVIPSRLKVDSTMLFAGARTRSITFEDPLTRRRDSIKYHYPYPGELVYSDFYRWEAITYDFAYTDESVFPFVTHNSFTDNIIHSGIRYEGSPFLNLGNHGVYYDYVEEEFVGKGKRTYLFFTPRRQNLPNPLFAGMNADSVFLPYIPHLAAMSDAYKPYKFWLNGIPLGSATYDNYGNLRALTRNYYWADDTGVQYKKLSHIYHNNGLSQSWFLPGNAAIKYSKYNRQIKAYDYFLDHDYLSEHYQSQGHFDINLGEPSLFNFNIHNDIYVPNFFPRTHTEMLNYEDQAYSLAYGGKVLLRAQEEFRIEGNDPLLSGPCIGHFVADLGTPFNKVEYFYDNVAE
ncbi:MAG: hypothetical protein FWE10_07375, partial [Rikenellaceae bacterium]|nr:hypothetical protein [Rikenellaceae bacterium]